MARARLPTKVAILHGTHKANPGRFARQGRENEPQNTDPLPPDPPDWMTEPQKEVYSYIIRICHKDVLTIADQSIVEMVAVLLCKFRAKQGDVHPNLIGKLYSGLDRLGMTPSARSKVSAVKRDNGKQNPLSEFAA
ncbi:MAG: hypothetical protein IT364_16820 [Candidatus Hydrogenedentes bacterium]|jgi:phage terminase small subunit|nr:hypothetical protein [Candidatus Hydrogenedentota bacterium]